MTIMDLDRRLHCLSLYSTPRIVAMSSFSSFLQMMGNTIDPTSTSGSVLVADNSTSVSGSVLVVEDEDVKEAKVERKGVVCSRFGGL